MIDLITLNRAARPRTQDAIDRSIVVPLLRQRPLHVRCHIARRSLAVAEDRAIVNVVAVIGIISVGRIPPAVVPIPVTASVKDEAEIVAPPPIPFVTFPPIPAARLTKRELISGAFVMAPRLFVPLRIVVGDNVRLFGFFGALDVLLIVVIAARPDVRMRLLVRAVGHLLIAARLRADMPITGLRADMPIASLRRARLCRARSRLGGLRFFLLLFLLIVGLRGLDRCQANQ